MGDGKRIGDGTAYTHPSSGLFVRGELGAGAGPRIPTSSIGHVYI